MSRSKKKILIYADTPEWAYDSILKFIRHNFSSEYDIYFDYTFCHKFIEQLDLLDRVKIDFVNLLKYIYRSIKGQHSSLTVYSLFNYKLKFFWQRKFVKDGKYFYRRVLPYWTKYDAVILLDYYFDRVAKLSYKTNKLVKGIYTEGFPPDGCEYDFITKRNPKEIKSIDEFCNEYIKNSNALIVGAPSISAIYCKYNRNIHFCNGIQREELFLERKKFRKGPNKTLVVGWTGNPKRNFKNFYTIVEPSVKALIARGFDVQLKTRFSGPYESLPAFYDDVDVVLIASEKDAGPSLFAEASLCGVPSISSRIGWPLYVIEHMKNGILVDLRVEEYVKHLEYIHKNRNELERMSNCIRIDYLQKMGGTKLKENWQEMFRSIGL